MVFPYFDRLPSDWDGAYRAFLPRIMAAEQERDVHLLLAEFLNLLGERQKGACLARFMVTSFYSPPALIGNEM